MNRLNSPTSKVTFTADTKLPSIQTLIGTPSTECKTVAEVLPTRDQVYFTTENKSSKQCLEPRPEFNFNKFAMGSFKPNKVNINRSDRKNPARGRPNSTYLNNTNNNYLAVANNLTVKKKRNFTNRRNTLADSNNLAKMYSSNNPITFAAINPIPHSNLTGHNLPYLIPHNVPYLNLDRRLSLNFSYGQLNLINHVNPNQFIDPRVLYSNQINHYNKGMLEKGDRKLNFYINKFEK